MKAWSAAMCLVLFGCGTKDPAPPVGSSLTEAERHAANKLANAQDEFAFRVKDCLLLEEKKGNFCFSPLSIGFCLSLLLNGADGDSKNLLAKALSYDSLPIEQVNAGNQALMQGMSGGRFAVANSIWLRPDLRPKPTFSKVMESNYSAQFFSGRDFGPSTIKEVNAWCDKATHGMIRSIYDELPPSTELIALSALAFEGRWAREFDSNDTRPADFTTEGAERISVAMMSVRFNHDDRAVSYGETDGATALNMKYSGGHFSFLIVLPPSNVPAREYLAALTPDKFRNLLGKMNPGEGTLKLPRFTIQSGRSLDRTMRGLGLGALYEGCNLARIDDGLAHGVPLLNVRQQCYLAVDEKGTRASAASAVLLGSDSRRFQMVVNRPFVFALLHSDTGAIVFVGLVADPRTS